MNSYPIVKLEDFADVKGGKRTPKGASVQEEKTNHRYIRVKDFNGHDLNRNGIGYITEDTHKKIQRYTISKDDIFISIAGTIGVIGKIPEKLDSANLTENAAKITNISDQFNKDYLIYFLRSKYGQQIIKGRTTGTSQPKLALFRIREFEIPKPPKETQQKIASVLSAFDDLIENNTRRIEILEEMARRIYCEWFVHFRYPGHEADELVDSGTELGEIPEGWEVKEVDDIVNRLSKGNIYRKKNTDDEGDIIIIDQSTDEYLGFHDNEPDFPARPDEPYIIFGDHTCKMQLLIRPFSLGPNVVPFIAEDEELSNYYLYYLLEPIIESREYKRHWTTFKVKKVAVAPTEIADRFEKKVRPLLEQKENLKKQINKLKETRDLLLPKLISGKIDVEEIKLTENVLE